MIGVGYRPRTGTVFFTRNGKKLDDVAHGLKTQNFFPTIGANGPSTIHVNFGQSGFVFIEANVKKWGLAPMVGSLPPPPPYGSEQGSILLEAGREGAQSGQGGYMTAGQSRSRSGVARSGPPASPGPVRSNTDISLAQLAHIRSNEDAGEGTSRSGGETAATDVDGEEIPSQQEIDPHDFSAPPPDYSSPEGSELGSRRSSGDSDDERRPMMRTSSPRPPIPSYDAAVGNDSGRRREGDTYGAS